MSSAVRRWLLLVLAVLAVGAALWVLQRPPAREREPRDADGAAAARAGASVGESAAAGVAPIRWE